MCHSVTRTHLLAVTCAAAVVLTAASVAASPALAKSTDVIDAHGSAAYTPQTPQAPPVYGAPQLPVEAPAPPPADDPDRANPYPPAPADGGGEHGQAPEHGGEGEHGDHGHEGQHGDEPGHHWEDQPGHHEDEPGHHGDEPGHHGDEPGHHGDQPGHDDDHPGPGDGAPGAGDGPPAHPGTPGPAGQPNHPDPGLSGLDTVLPQTVTPTGHTTDNPAPLATASSAGPGAVPAAAVFEVLSPPAPAGDVHVAGAVAAGDDSVSAGNRAVAVAGATQTLATPLAAALPFTGSDPAPLLLLGLLMLTGGLLLRRRAGPR